jgi:hypothetical protein
LNRWKIRWAGNWTSLLLPARRRKTMPEESEDKLPGREVLMKRRKKKSERPVYVEEKS